MSGGTLYESDFEEALARMQFLQTAAEYILANSVEKKGQLSFMRKYKAQVVNTHPVKKYTVSEDDYYAQAAEKEYKY